MTEFVIQLMGVTAAVVAAVGCVAIFSAEFRTRNIRIRRQLVRVSGREASDIGSSPLSRFLLALGRRVLRQSPEYQKVTRLAHSAGFFSSHAAYQVVAVQFACGCALAITGTLISISLGHGFERLLLSTIAGATFGYFLPKICLVLIAAERRKRIRRELPFFIDMLLLLLRSGAGIDRCFREIANLAHDAIPEIHRTIVLLMVDLHQGRSYEEGLDRWADRMSEPAAQEIARQLQQAMSYGTELSKTLGQFSQRLISQMLSNGRELAGRRTTHVTVATVAFFMPPLMIILAAPGFASLIRIMAGN